MDFGDALKALKQGKKVARTGWMSNYPGGHMFIAQLPDPYANQIMCRSIGDNAETWPFAGAQLDLLSEDWEILSD